MSQMWQTTTVEDSDSEHLEISCTVLVQWSVIVSQTKHSSRELSVNADIITKKPQNPRQRPWQYSTHFLSRVQSKSQYTSLSACCRFGLISLPVKSVCSAAPLRANPGPTSERMTADELKPQPGGRQQSGGKGVTFWQDAFVTLT